MAPGLNDFDGRIYPLLALSEEVGPEKLDFFGPKWHLLCSLQVRSQISIDFQGPPIKETSRRGPGIFCSRLIWVKGEHFRSIAQEISPSALKIYLRHWRNFAFLSVCMSVGEGPLSRFTVTEYSLQLDRNESKDRCFQFCGSILYMQKEVYRDSATRYSISGFFMNHFPPSPWVSHKDCFEFFQNFAEIFIAQGAPLVPLTLVANLPPVLLIPGAICYWCRWHQWQICKCFFKICKSQIRKFLGSIRNQKSANFWDMWVQKFQIRKFLLIKLQITNLHISLGEQSANCKSANFPP